MERRYLVPAIKRVFEIIELLAESCRGDSAPAAG